MGFINPLITGGHHPVGECDDFMVFEQTEIHHVRKKRAVNVRHESNRTPYTEKAKNTSNDSDSSFTVHIYIYIYISLLY